MGAVTAQPADDDMMAQPCPVCGSYTGTTVLASPSALLAVCDVLVVWALAAMGKRIVRAKRERYGHFQGRPWHIAHTFWPPDDPMMDKGLEGAWDVVPAMLDTHGCCGVTSRQVVLMLDAYVRDLLATGTAHNLTDLRYRFETRLHIELPEPAAPYTPGLVAGGH